MEAGGALVTIDVAIGVAPAVAGASSSGAVVGAGSGPFPREVSGSGTISGTDGSCAGGGAPLALGAAAGAASVEGAAGSVALTSACRVIDWGAGSGSGLGAGSGVRSGVGTGVGSGAVPGFESTGGGIERVVLTGEESTGIVVPPGTGLAPVPLVVVTLSTVPCWAVW